MNANDHRTPDWPRRATASGLVSGTSIVVAPPPAPLGHFDELRPPLRIGKQRLDDMERREARGDQMGGRPAAPGSDLEAPVPGEKPCVGIEDRRLVTVDEADDRIASVDAKSVIDVPAQPGPGRDAFVDFDHVGKQVIERRRREIVRDIILRHRSNPIRMSRRARRWSRKADRTPSGSGSRSAGSSRSRRYGGFVT